MAWHYLKMEKMDDIGIKRIKIWEVLVEKSKKFCEKNPNLINTQDLIIAQGGFIFPKTINAQYLISMHGLDFDPKNNKRARMFNLCVRPYFDLSYNFSFHMDVQIFTP